MRTCPASSKTTQPKDWMATGRVGGGSWGSGAAPAAGCGVGEGVWPAGAVLGWSAAGGTGGAWAGPRGPAWSQG
eukprot:8197882-Alexandrium_andersonii.AAC.1